MQEETRLIDHFSHQHRLKLYKEIDPHKMDPSSKPPCHLCGRADAYQGIPTRMTMFPLYACRDCGIFIHKSCAKFPQELSHRFHPNHVLYLQEISAIVYLQEISAIVSHSSGQQSIQCHACGINETINSSGYIYHCPECKFNLDIFCSQLKPNRIHEAHTPQNSHQHPLFVCNKLKFYDEFQLSCSFCQNYFRPGQDEIFVCLDCKNLLHESCAVPHEIGHPFHLEHPLTILNSRSSPGHAKVFKCNACSRDRPQLFCCSQCKFSLDLDCATLMPAIEPCEPNRNHQSFTHPHPLILCENVKKIPDFECSGCGRIFMHQDSIFVCLECGILLDKYCAELPLEIMHSFHPLHPLELAQLSRLWRADSTIHKFWCNVCFRSITDFFLYYECPGCQFYTHPRCASITAVQLVKSEIHDHPLAFLRTQPSDDQLLLCDICNELCSNNFFQCVSCKTGYHLNCYPFLPPVIKHDCHCDPLELTDSRIREMSDVDSDEEFFCHACEETRDFDDIAYYCKECRFVAHTHCVVSEILRYIATDPADVDPPAALLAELPEAQSNLSEVAGVLKDLPKTHSNLSEVAAVLEELPERQSNLSEVATTLEELQEAPSNPTEGATILEELPEGQCNLSEVAAVSEELSEAQFIPSEVDQKKSFGNKITFPLKCIGLFAFGYLLANAAKILISMSKQ